MERIIKMQLPNQNKVCYKLSGYKKEMAVTKGFSLRFIFSGNGVVHVGNKSLNIFPDSFLALTDGTSYTEIIHSRVSVTSLSINYSNEYIKEFMNSHSLFEGKQTHNTAPHLSPFAGKPDILQAFGGDLRYTVSHLKNHLIAGQHNELLVEEYLYQSLLNYHQQVKNDNFENTKNMNSYSDTTQREILRRVSLAKEYLYSNYNSNVDLKELASYSCLSVTHLLRTFKQTFHTTPHQFLIKLRLQRAKFLLKDSAYPVKEIVRLVGFDSTSSFIKLFRERYQTTPLHYRNN